MENFEFAKDIIKETSKLKNVPQDQEEPINLTSFKLLQLIHTFFDESLTTEFFSSYLNSYLKTNFNFTKNIIEDTYYGLLTYDYKNDKSKLEVCLRGYFDDLATIAHEFGHNIELMINPKKEILFLQDEITSTFMQILCSIYYEQDFLKQASISYQKRLLSNVLDEAKYIENTKDYSTPDIHYLLDYIVSINILAIYESDPEYALYILKQIIYFDELKTNYEMYKFLNNYDLFNPENIANYRKQLIRKKI